MKSRSENHTRMIVWEDPLIFALNLVLSKKMTFLIHSCYRFIAHRGLANTQESNISSVLYSSSRKNVTQY